jgi:glycosyltransferase involved in cell wall biosynthesis
MRHRKIIWIIHPYGELPDEKSIPYRASMMAEVLTNAGHDVIWWVASYDHLRRVNRFSEDAKTVKYIQVNSNYKIGILPTRSYFNNISINRILFFSEFIRGIEKVANECETPDLAIVLDPVLFMSGGVLRMQKKLKFRIIMDMVDTWPELFASTLPRQLKFLNKIIFFPLYFLRYRVYRKASAIVTVADNYMQIAKKINHSLSANRYQVIPYCTDVLGIRSRQNLTGFQKDPFFDKWQSVGILASNLGSKYDVLTVVAAMKILQEKGSKIGLIIAGEGQLKEKLIQLIEFYNLNNILYIGRQPGNIINQYFSICGFGIASYVGNTTVSIPIKLIFHMAFGLPTLNSISSGDIYNIIKEKKVGLNYEAEDALSLANAILEITKDKNVLEGFRKRAFAEGNQFDYKERYLKFNLLIEKIYENN